MPLTEEALASGISYAGSECDPSGDAAIQGRTSSTRTRRAAEHNIISSSDAIDDPDHNSRLMEQMAARDLQADRWVGKAQLL